MAWTIPELEIMRHPMLVRRLRSARGRIHEVLTPLTASVATTPEPVPFAEGTRLTQRPVTVGSTWGKAGTCAWFHLTVDLPADATDLSDLALVIDTDGEALVHADDGTIVGVVTSRLTPVERHAPTRAKTLLWVEALGPAVRDGRVSLWLDAGFNGKVAPPYGTSRIRALDLVRVDRAAEDAYYDLLTVAYASLRAGGHSEVYAAALDRGFAEFAGGRFSAVRAALAPVLDGAVDEGLALTGLGHAHLDMAWLWPLRETRRKAHRTFRAQLDLLEAHPDLLFGGSQPVQFGWIEQDDPELFERMRAAVTAGRFELQGGFWVEPDTNLPSGESLVRQAIHGQRYWQSRFGRRVTTCWLPDAFGYSGALPQILRGAGMDTFLTIKLAWNEHNDFPHRSFVWEGIDGSSVLVHMPPEGTYTSSATGLAFGTARDQYPEREVAPIGMILFGTGDGGGGPSEVHVQLAQRGAQLLGLPRLTAGTAADFFGELTAYEGVLPHYRGELYLEKHQGTFTTQGAVKAGNRRIEHELHDVEYLLAQALWRGVVGAGWPTEWLDRTWEEFLLHQFHDMLPGSSIERVHRETRELYARLSGEIFDATAGLLATQHDDALPPAFVNTTPVRRTGWVHHAGRWWHHEVAPFATAALVAHGGHGDGLGHEGDAMWNDRLRVGFGADGTITSLLDLASGREHARGALGRLVVHRDPFSMFDAWDIAIDYPTRGRDVLTPLSAHTFVDGPRVVRRHEYVHGRTRIRQDVVLVAGEDLVRFETSVDWHERHRMLRAEFEPEAWADEVACEIQFGHLMRSTRDETPQERAQFEICAHRWVDVSDPGGFGFSVLNDSKYGHRVKDRLISLALLRAPIYPDRAADRGRHQFTYAVHPHEGGLGPSTTIAARSLNAPVIVAQVPEASPSLVVTPTTVLIDSVTTDHASVPGDEARGDLVLRIYESAGVATTASVSLAGPFADADLTQVRKVNLLLDDLGPDGSVDMADLSALPLHPFEVVTLRIPRT